MAYINAHGTSTAYNDKFETMAIKVFGDSASKLAISSTKSMTGHTLGAAGSIEAAIAAKVMQTGVCPPTINYNTEDPECDLNYVPNVALLLEGEAESCDLGLGPASAATTPRLSSRSTSRKSVKRLGRARVWCLMHASRGKQPRAPWRCAV